MRKETFYMFQKYPDEMTAHFIHEYTKQKGLT